MNDRVSAPVTTRRPVNSTASRKHRVPPARAVLRIAIAGLALVAVAIGGATPAAAQEFDVYVSDAGRFQNPPWQILKVDSNGDNATVFIDEELAWPQDIVFLEDEGTVLISNLSSNRITVHDAETGDYIRDFATGIDGPTRMKIGADSLLYVLQWLGDGKVLRYQLDGTFVDEFTSEGVLRSIGLDWDAGGNLYVSSYNADSVRKFGPDGTDMGLFIDSDLVGPTNIWFDDAGDLLVVDYDGGDVKRFSPTGEFLGVFIDGLQNAEGVAMLPDGDLLIGNGGDHSVKRFESDGTYVEDFVASGTADLLRPNAVVLRDRPVAAPTAGFEFSADMLTVEFTDTSTGEPTSWSWEFGDGESSSEQNPTHEYAAAGTYTVTLTVVNDGGSDQASEEVTVEADPGSDLTQVYVIPAAAKASGAQGAFFFTDGEIHNGGTAVASYRFAWLPRDTDNQTPTVSEIFSLGPAMSVRYVDLVGDVFGLDDEAVGAVVVFSDSADLVVATRTYNRLSTEAGGTFGQALPGIPAAELIPADERRRIIFMVEDSEFRSNLGVANGTGEPIRIEWELFTPDGVSVETGAVNLPAWGNTQLNRVFRDVQPVQGGYVDVWTTTPGGAFAAYGSLLDNLTSDPTTILPG